MDMQRINRTDAERIFITVLNTEASSMTTGYAVSLAVAGAAASADGHQAIMPLSGTAGTLPGWCGVAAEDIPANTRGRVQSYGYAASIYLSQVASSITVTLGDALTPGAVKGGLFSAVPTYLLSGFRYALVISAPPTLSGAVTTNYTSGVLRCL